MATRIGMSGPGDTDLVLRVGADGAPVTVPDAHFLFTATFERAGSDLVLSNEDGQSVLIVDYFAAPSPVDLAAPNGALLRAPVVDALAGPLAPGQYAQAGAATGAAPIGQVETLEGTATAQRTDGTRVTLKIGDPVFQGDVVQSGPDSKLGITFIDKTVFTLSDQGRMVLDEMVYSPGGSDNSMLINLVQGTFVFVAGGVAPSGDMKVQTPVATMGIRGTTVISRVSAVDGTSVLSLDIDPDGEQGFYQIIDTASGLVLATVTRTGENWVITPPSEPGQPPDIRTVAKNDNDLFNDQGALQFLYQTFQLASARFANSPDGDGNSNSQDSGPSSVPGSGVDSDVDPDALNPLDPGFTPNTGEQDPAPSGEPIQPNAPPQNNNNDQSNIPRQPPTSEGAFVTTDEDTPSGGIDVPVEGIQPGDPVEVTITELPARGLLLLDGQEVALGDVIPIEDTELLTFSPNGEFEELTAQDLELLQFSYTVGFPGETASEPVVAIISVPGVNDDPVAVNDTANGGENEALTIDVLANDTDVDRNDDPSNFLLTQAAILSVTGAVLTDATVTIANNQLVFNPGTNFDALGSDDTANVTVQYTMTDDEGASSTGQVVITVGGENDAPVAQRQIVETDTETQASGQLLVQDVDAGDGFTFAPAGEGPSNGEVTILPDGAFTYIPDEAFQGFDEFTFQVTDLAGETSTATVIVEVTTENFSNPNGQTITFGIDGDNPLSSGIGVANVEIDVSEVSGAFINVSFVFDASGSLGSAAYGEQMAAIQTAIDDMRVQFLNSQTQLDIQLVRFSSATTTVEHDLYASDLDDVAALLPFTGGGTNFDDALAEAESFFNGEPPGDQNFLFFISDGQPFGSSDTNPPWETTAQNLQNAGVIISAFGIGPDISPATLDQIDNTGGSENVNQASDLSDAFSGTPIFAAQLVDFSLNLVADGVNQGEIADEADLQDDGINSDLPLADVAGLAGLLGEENQFSATTTFDFDGNLGTTDDQITLFSAETISASANPVTKTGTVGNDLLLGGFQDDEISGGGGQDIVLGFSGDDSLEVSDTTFHKVDGGTGQDTLVLDETDLDLTSFDLSKLASIERIDLKEASADTLTLDFNAVMALSETVNDELNDILESFFGAGNAPTHSLVVDGGASDTVALVDDSSGSWTELTGPAFAGYDIYAFENTDGAVLAAVAIDDDVTVPPATV